MLNRSLFLQVFFLAALSAIGYTDAEISVGSDIDRDANGSAARQLRSGNSEVRENVMANRQLVSGKGKGKGKGGSKGKGKGKVS
jgi:hypothetical protein